MIVSVNRSFRGVSRRALPHGKFTSLSKVDASPELWRDHCILLVYDRPQCMYVRTVYITLMGMVLVMLCVSARNISTIPKKENHTY